jgi:spore maturation protein CgeB
MRDVDVLITGGTPDRVNRNAGLRGLVAEGFAEFLGDHRVLNVPPEAAGPRIKISRPRLVLVFGSCLPDQCEFSGLRRACDDAGCPLAFWLHDDPYEFDAAAKVVRIADHIFTNDRWAAEHYHRENVWHLPLAASARAHTARLGAKPSTQRDVFFCGVAYPGRLRMLKDLSAVLDRAHTEVFGEGWDTDVLRFCKNDRLQPEQLPEYYASSAIVLNLGRDFYYANRKYQLAPSTPGPRTFEAAMAGACQFFFVDSLEILDYFNADKEIVLFNDPTEFEARLKELLNDVERRKQIGNAARTRCLREHTYTARARQILERLGLPIRRVADQVPEITDHSSRPIGAPLEQARQRRDLSLT